MWLQPFWLPFIKLCSPHDILVSGTLLVKEFHQSAEFAHIWLMSHLKSESDWPLHDISLHNYKDTSIGGISWHVLISWKKKLVVYHNMSWQIMKWLHPIQSGIVCNPASLSWYSDCLLWARIVSDKDPCLTSIHPWVHDKDNEFNKSFQTAILYTRLSSSLYNSVTIIIIKWSLMVGIWDRVRFLACEKCKMYPKIICHTWICP